MSDTQPTPYGRKNSPEAEEQGVLVWMAQFPKIDALLDKLGSPYMVVEERSTLALDNPYLGSFRNGGLHVSAMNAAVDALHTIKALLDRPDGEVELPMSGHYPVLRSAIENGALAMYLLGPEGRDERLARAYKVAAEDSAMRFKFHTGMGNAKAAEAHTDTIAEIRRLVAMRAGLGDPAKFDLALARHTAIVTEAEARLHVDPAIPALGKFPLLAMWQVLSGLSHGKQWAFIEIMERTNVIEDKDSRSAQVTMTSPTTFTALALHRAVELLESTLRLFGRRSKAAWALPEDASEPR